MLAGENYTVSWKCIQKKVEPPKEVPLNEIMRKMGLEGIVQLLIIDRKGVSNSSILTVTKV